MKMNKNSEVNLEINKKKFLFFLDICKKLNKINIIPILYGSLGLNFCIGEFTKSDDIDILLSLEYFDEKWDSFLGYMEKFGFKLKDLHEHEFEKEGVVINFSKNDLDVFAGINLEELNEINVNHAKFKVLSAEHYLKVYSQSRRDGYRVEKRGKQDQEKINQIKNFLEVKTR